MSSKERGAALNTLAADTAQRLHSFGQLPEVHVPQAAPKAAAAGAPAAGAGGPQVSAEASAAMQKAAAEAAAEAARNQSRLTNVGAFFVCYALFKYVADNDLM